MKAVGPKRNMDFGFGIHKIKSVRFTFLRNTKNTYAANKDSLKLLICLYFWSRKLKNSHFPSFQPEPDADKKRIKQVASNKCCAPFPPE